MTDKKTTPKKVEVTLLKDHKHEGKDRKAGEKIMVTPGQKTFLADPSRKIIASGTN